MQNPTQSDIDQFCEEVDIHVSLGVHKNVLPVDALLVSDPTEGCSDERDPENWPVQGLLTPLMPGKTLFSQLQSMLPR